MRPSIYDSSDPQYWIDRAADVIINKGIGALFDSELGALADSGWRRAVETRVGELLEDTRDPFRIANAQGFLRQSSTVALSDRLPPSDQSLLDGPLPENLPVVTTKAGLITGSRDTEGLLVQAVAIPWFEILKIIRQNPNAIYHIDPRDWEEIIAGAYKAAGFDEVVLTPRSADKGRDVVATKTGIGSIRIFDQVKAYGPGRVVTAEEVRAMLGVISGAQNVSKGVITTTAHFAPKLRDDPYIRPFLPYRLELKARGELLAWLRSICGK